MGYRFDIRQSIDAREDLQPNERRTICDVHREVYLMARDEMPSEISGRVMALMAEAFDMGKRMSAALTKRRDRG